MKSLLEFGPVAAFFLAFQFSDLITATWILMGAQLVAAVLYRLLAGRLGIQMQAQSGFVFGFGGLTVYLQDPIFIMWKPTLINGAFALILIGGNLIGQKSMLSRLLGGQLPLPEAVWRTLSWYWAGAFTLSAVLNLVVAYNFSEAFWVSYKLFGGIGLTVLYTALMLIYLGRKGYLKAPEDRDP
jgi:intracellular septation protein